jgi:hypothetical protein
MSAPNPFPPTSRYYLIETATRQGPGGETIVYLRRRFVPPPERFQTVAQHVVVEGERLDNIIVHYLGDPEQFWRLCDANNALRPEELTETPNKTIRITLPEGLSSGSGSE